MDCKELDKRLIPPLHSLLSSSEKLALHRFLTAVISGVDDSIERMQSIRTDANKTYVDGQIAYWRTVNSGYKHLRYRIGHKAGEE